MNEELIIPRGEEPIPGRTEVETETMSFTGRGEVRKDGKETE